MIEDLTAERLSELISDKSRIEQILTHKGAETHFSFNGEYFFAVTNEKKLYSGIEAHQKNYLGNEDNLKFPIDCPDLLGEYFFLKQSNYIKKEMAIVGLALFEKAKAKEDFKASEIAFAKTNIDKYTINEALGKAFPNYSKRWEYYLNKLNKFTEQTTPKTFDEIFEDAIKSKEIAIENKEDKFEIETQRSYLHFSFNVWLKEKGFWEFGDRSTYLLFSTNEKFSEFLEYEGNVLKLRQKAIERNNKRKGLEVTEKEIEVEQPTEPEQKIPAKFYALYHWILIEMGIERHFETNENGLFDRTKIETFAENRYPNTSKQGFYRAFKNEINLSDKKGIALSFGKGYKETIIKISNNDAKVITHLKDYPN